MNHRVELVACPAQRTGKCGEADHRHFHRTTGFLTISIIVAFHNLNKYSIELENNIL